MSLSLPRYFACLAIGYTLIALYGSLVPLEFVWPSDGLEAVRRAWVELRARGTISVFDAAANVALFVPLGFLWSAVVLFTGSRVHRVARSAAVICTAALFSSGIELLQVALPARTVSPLDVLAETAGAALGCAAWWLTGRPLSIWLATQQASEPRARILNSALQLYLFIVTIWWLWPLDLSSRPGELAAKLHGNMVLKPFSDVTAERTMNIGLTLGLFVPVGVLFATAGRTAGRQPRSEFECRWFVLGLMAVLAAGQLLVLSRTTDVLVVAALGLGCSAGVWLTRWFQVGACDQNRSALIRALVPHEASIEGSAHLSTSIRPSHLVYGLLVALSAIGLIWYATAVTPGELGLIGRRFPNWQPTWPFLLYWSVAIGTLALAPRWPVLGPIVFVLLGYGVFHRGHVAAEFFRALGGLDLIAVLGLAGAWLARPHVPPRLGSQLTVVGLAAAYMIWCLASAANLWLDGRPWKEEVSIQCFRLIDCAIVCWMAGLIVPTRRWHDWLSLVLTVGILLPGVLFPRDMYQNHVTATILAIVLPLTLHLLFTRRSVALQILLGLVLIKFAGMIYVSQSRSAIAGAGAGVLAYAVLSSYRWQLLALLVPAGALTWWLTQSSYVAERFGAIFSQQPGWDTGRIALWEYAIQVFRTFPIFGMGPGTGPEGLHDVHNSYLAALSETGAVGLALYVLFWLATILVLGRLIWSARDFWNGSAAKPILAAIIAYLVAGLGYSLHALQLGFLLAGWAFALAAARPGGYTAARAASSTSRAD